MRVLIAEDDPRIQDMLARAMRAAGFVAEVTDDGEDAHFRGETEGFDAVLLDLGLPRLDGLTILKRWRKADVSVPVLILTARGQWEERVEGIEAGADDYVVKPFRIEEVVARVKALIRRAGGHASSQIVVDDLVVDTRLMRVVRGGVPLNLTPQEYRLVAFLANQRGRVVSQMEIIEHLYSQDYDRASNSVEVLVGRVRRRVGTDAIKTRRGFGYYMGDDAG
ncbi:DNA-binding response regulator, OmpR family, contains REC and winged-helix (wHTH) domain [Devosia enhydra]|uniref:DNA-binding response regulator, OmpR family, contains REC and winged-helix (WHTH) domain n=1 Tax=Devosia enhydra TaxID=665118 RepID=A0A1K2HVP9_9HYPH|nr:response regulator transcription factor [Devosia enhydra]SFZ82527.1 DNA-binding response regulator, OmpR family, contains REC and winged-helix (wHTH) domain [Devosia enhydra]